MGRLPIGGEERSVCGSDLAQRIFERFGWLAARYGLEQVAIAGRYAVGAKGKIAYYDDGRWASYDYGARRCDMAATHEYQPFLQRHSVLLGAVVVALAGLGVAVYLRGRAVRRRAG